jgi:FdhD protein
MIQTKELDIIRLNSDGKSIKKDLIVKELPFTILINNQEIVTLLCSPDKLEYLAVGFLLSEGLIRNDTQIKRIGLGKDGHYANVELDRDFQIPQNFFQKRLIGSGCGKGVSFYDSQDVDHCESTNSDIRIGYEQIVNFMKIFQEKSTLFKNTGGVHSAALCNLNEIEIFAEDIGRHNALDKIFGECFLNNISTEDKIILTSGRITSEILIKIAKRKVPIIISRAAATDLAVGLADQLRLTLVGFVRGKRMNIYTHNFRIEEVEKSGKENF